MSTALIAIAALLPSLVLVSLIALRDPKRLRSRPESALAKSRTGAWSRKQRRIATALVLLPATVLVATGAWPAFLIWLGALLAAGWLWVNWLAPRGSRT